MCSNRTLRLKKLFLNQPLPTRARHLSMPIAFGGAYPAGGCAPGGLKGQMPPNDLEHAPPLAVTIDKSNRRVRRKGVEATRDASGRTRKLVPPDLTSGDASPTGECFYETTGGRSSVVC